MNVLDRYIGRTIAGSVGMVMAVLLALFFFAGLADEFHKLGRGSYDIVDALQYTVLQLPKWAYEFFPLGALLGAVIGLGTLASNSELIVMRAAGVSIGRIALGVMKTGLVLMLVAFVLGEVISPPVMQYATEQRVKAMAKEVSFNTTQGLWAREGNTFVNVRRVDQSGRLLDVHLYQFDDAHRMQVMTHARSALPHGDEWVLHGVQQARFGPEGMVTRSQKQMRWQTLLNRQVVNVVAVEPRTLAIWDLRRYIDYLHDNGLGGERYELAFWSKVVAPFTTGVMIFLAIPFVFGSLRTVPIGQRILGGFLVGMGFYLANQIAGHAALVYDLPPGLSAALPTVAVFVAAVLWLRRLR